MRIPFLAKAGLPWPSYDAPVILPSLPPLPLPVAAQGCWAYGEGAEPALALAARSRRSCSKSAHFFIVILLESNSPSYSSPAFLVFSPAVLRVSPQEKSSNFQYAYVGSTKFQIGSERR